VLKVVEKNMKESRHQILELEQQCKTTQKEAKNASISIDLEKKESQKCH
jgi:hypothetical protein